MPPGVALRAVDLLGLVIHFIIDATGTPLLFFILRTASVFRRHDDAVVLRSTVYEM